jgi:hypothetical protein
LVSKIHILKCIYFLIYVYIYLYKTIIFMEGKKDTQLIVKISKELHEKLNRYIEENCLNKSAFVRKLLENKINEINNKNG